MDVVNPARVAARYLRASEIPWGVEDRWPWFKLPKWPPDRQVLREVEHIVSKETSAFEVIYSSHRPSVDLQGHVFEEAIAFRPDGRMDVYVPMLLPRCPAVPSKVIRGLDVRHALLTPRGDLVASQEGVPLPGAVAALRGWLSEHGEGLRTQRGRGVFRRSGVFIRFGRWGSSSQVFLNEQQEDTADPGFDRRFEAGVSVYAAKPLTSGGYALVPPNPREAIHSVGADYMPYMLRRMRHRIADGEVFLVSGTWVSADGERIYGADGEPVLEPSSLRVLAELSPTEVFWQGRSVAEILGLTTA